MVETTVAEAYAHCRRVTRTAAKNFYYAFVTLPPRRRRAIYAAYAFCRLCDDIADEPLPLEEKVIRLRQVQSSLEDAYNGKPEGMVFVALADAARTFGVPKEDVSLVVQGVEMDLTRSRYGTFEELWEYCYRVASAVGLICARILSDRGDQLRSSAVDLGLALQLTNILRDIPEDAARGRIYLPQEELRQFHYTEEELYQGVYNDRFVDLMRFQAARAWRYFESGKDLIPLLPVASRACPAILGGVYSRILCRIEARQYNVFLGRVALSTQEKLLLTLRLWSQSMLPWPRLATAW